MKAEIEKSIKNIWLKTVAQEFSQDYIYCESKLKDALFKHLNKKFEEEFFFKEGYRIFIDYHLPCGRIVDIAILKVMIDDLNEKELYEPIIYLEGIIEMECKYQTVSIDHKKLVQKLMAYNKYYPEAHIYTVLADDQGEGKPKWIKALEHNEDIPDSVTELLGYRDRRSKDFITKVFELSLNTDKKKPIHTLD